MTKHNWIYRLNPAHLKCDGYVWAYLAIAFIIIMSTNRE